MFFSLLVPVGLRAGAAFPAVRWSTGSKIQKLQFSENSTFGTFQKSNILVSRDFQFSHFRVLESQKTTSALSTVVPGCVTAFPSCSSRLEKSAGGNGSFEKLTFCRFSKKLKLHSEKNTKHKFRKNVAQSQLSPYRQTGGWSSCSEPSRNSEN